MSDERFVLPKAERYEVRFELRKRTRANRDQVARLVSQEVLSLTSPASGVYRVHGFDPASMTRSGTVAAEVSYVFEIRP
jgi:hypothetical protein